MTTTNPDLQVDDRPGGLATAEVFWRDHYNWLRECGYLLRPRYAPDWIPSWERDARKGEPYYRYEDAQMSAVRILFVVFSSLLKFTCMDL